MCRKRNSNRSEFFYVFENICPFEQRWVPFEQKNCSKKILTSDFHVNNISNKFK